MCCISMKMTPVPKSRVTLMAAALLRMQAPCLTVRLVMQVLHPVCHVRNLMLWTAVYLPSSSPTTPSDDSCAPYPEDPPLSR